MSNGASVCVSVLVKQRPNMMIWDLGVGATLRNRGKLHCSRLQICRVILNSVLNFVLNFQIDEMTNKIYFSHAKMPN